MGDCQLETLTLIDTDVSVPFPNKSGSLAKLTRLSLTRSNLKVPDRVSLDNVKYLTLKGYPETLQNLQRFMKRRLTCLSELSVVSFKPVTFNHYKDNFALVEIYGCGETTPR